MSKLQILVAQTLLNKLVELRTWVAALGIRLATEEAKRAEISDIFHKFYQSGRRKDRVVLRSFFVAVEPEMT